MVLKESISNFTERNSRHVGSEESFSTERRSMSSDSERTNEKGDAPKNEYQSELEDDDDDTSSVSAIIRFRNRRKGKNKSKIKSKGKELNKRENEDLNETTVIENDTNEENQTTITNKSIILFQISLFILYFIILLIGSCNFSFKLFQAKEKHLHESVANMKAPACANILKEKLNETELLFKEGKIKEVFYEEGNNDSNNNREHRIDKNTVYNHDNKKGRNNELKNVNSEVENKNNRHITAFFKYYFTRTKRFLKNDDKTEIETETQIKTPLQTHRRTKSEERTQTHNGPIKIFICLNSNGSIEYRNFYNIFFSFKGYLFRFLSFSWNEIKSVFVKKKQQEADFLRFFDNTTNINTYIINHFLYYHYLLNKNKYALLNKGYVNVEILFYMYLKNICYLHDLNYINEKQEQHSEYGWIQQLLYYDETESRLNWESKKNVGFIINRINEYLKDETFLNVLNSLYIQICRNDVLWNYLKKGGVCNTEREAIQHNLEEDWEGKKPTDCFSYERYYSLYNKIEHFREVNKFAIWGNMMKRKSNTVRVLKKLDDCTKRYIINLKNVPLNFFLNIFYDTPCYVYNKLITNLLSNYCKGLFLYFIIFLGCIHVFFSPFPITLVHFRRFFIYFLIIMYRLFIFYFIPSIIQYIFYKYTNFDEELKHIFDYSDHVILFSTLLFIISLETQAIKYTINHQKQSFDNFHYKYNRNLCFIFLKLVLYYYYILIFLFLYTSYFTSKYFHTPNEIFVAYFFSTFSIFILFYFFLYKGYFSFYNLGITSFACKEASVSPSVFSTPFLSNSNSILILKEKLSFD